MILDRQERQGWGAKVIDRLAADLREAFPGMHGFSPRNLLFMRSFAGAYPDLETVKQVVSHLPWGHMVRLLQREKDPEIRIWYARQAVAQGWSRSILELQMDHKAHERQGKAVTNFPSTLPPVDSDMATQVLKDPYLFDFLGTADTRREREVEQALVDHIQHFLLELGGGFAFVGRQVHLEVGDQDFFVDLLFYHLKLRCYVIVELKAVPFDPGFVGHTYASMLVNSGFALKVVADQLGHKDTRMVEEHYGHLCETAKREMIRSKSPGQGLTGDRRDQFKLTKNIQPIWKASTSKDIGKDLVGRKTDANR